MPKRDGFRWSSLNLTLFIDKELLDRARKAARAQEKSLNQVVREYLEQLSAAEKLDHALKEFRDTSGTGHRQDRRFKRDELHARK